MSTVQSNLDITNLDLRKICDLRNFLPLTNFSLHSKSQYKKFFEKVKYRYKNFFWQIFPIFLVKKQNNNSLQQQSNQTVDNFSNQISYV